MYEIGAHLRSSRGLYHHHGIYVGQGLVVHLSGERRKEMASAAIRLGTLAEFADGQPIEEQRWQQQLPGPEVAQRALSALRKPGYNLLRWNCETFAQWAKTGTPASYQVRQVVGTAVAAVVLVGLLRAISDEDSSDTASSVDEMDRKPSTARLSATKARRSTGQPGTAHKERRRRSTAQRSPR